MRTATGSTELPNKTADNRAVTADPCVYGDVTRRLQIDQSPYELRNPFPSSANKEASGEEEERKFP